MNIDQTEIAAYLQGISLFTRLSQAERVSLANKARLMTKKPNQILVHEGDTLSYIYILRQGKGLCYFLHPDGKKTIIYHIRQDKPFAVETALTGTRHNGIIEIVEDAIVLAIPVDRVTKLMHTDAAFASQVAYHTMDCALRLTDLLKDLSFGAPARLGRYLFRRALEAGEPYGEGVCFDLGMRKGVLADFLGITPETLSRMFSQLQNEEVITVKRSKITVNNIKNLVHLSEGFCQEQQGNAD